MRTKTMNKTKEMSTNGKVLHHQDQFVSILLISDDIFHISIKFHKSIYS